ncbi:lactonase family protein [Maribacter sp. 2210JD10-5]|uniref:lactonase family protein n=1 Tax=Maribacter sp. 2210JD10-5 TaxID=3386272 RepID=UPI0039BC4079
MKKTILFLSIVLSFSCTQNKNDSEMTNLYVGTYTDGDSEGIYQLKFNTETGALTQKIIKAKLPNPSFLAITKDKKNLYAVQETNSFENDAGAVTAFAMKNDSLIELNTVSTGGAHPCHVSLSPDGDKLAVSNYSGGNASVFNIDAEGKIAGQSAFMDHKKLDTLKTPHAHMAQWLNNEIYIADLGLDALLVYEDDDMKNAKPTAKIPLPTGAGPRHFTSTQNGKFLYVINELNSSISVFEKDVSGNYTSKQNESTLAEDFKGESFCADIHISKDEKFLYGSNRGENTIVIFSIDQESGRLTLVGRESVKGDWPRNFAIDPSGKFLLVANQKSNNITVFKRNTAEGTLTFMSEMVISSPVCLQFLN